MALTSSPQRLGALLSALIVVLGSTLAMSPVHAEVRNPDGVAVIIGNKEYEHELIPDVAFAHRDAVAFKQYAIAVLGYDPDNIIQILDGDLRQMEQMFGTKNSHEHQLWSRLNPNGGSDVVVFYSGHGVPGTAAGDHEPRGYLLPTDARPENAVQDGYSVDLLYGNLNKLLEARSIVVYLDACFSGGSDAGELLRDASPVYLAAELPAGDRVTVLTASGGKEIASWDRDNQHGLFTYHLLDALYGSADQDDDGAVTASEVHLYLDRHMTRAARRKYDRSQHAELMGPGGAVLASASAGGVFPPRVKLREDGTLAADTPVARMAHASVQQDLLLLGMRRAHEAGEYQDVLEYVTKLEAMGGPLPLDALYFQGQAYLHLERNQEAQAVLTEYLAVSGREGKHYQDVLEQLLEIEDLLTADDVAFEQAQSVGTAASYEEYLRTHEDGRHAERARRLHAIAKDDEAFARARSTDTVATYASYLKTYPNGRHVAEVRGLHDALVRQQEQDDKAFSDAKAEDTSAAYATYIKTYPNGRHGAEALRLQQAAKDNEAFAAAKVAATSTAYGDYLRAQPNGRHVAEARRLQAMARDDEAFASAKAANTSTAYGDYLSRHSRGRHAGEARRLRAVAQDDEAFASAKAAATSDAYRDYLRRYSQGRHAADVRRLLTVAEDDEAYARAKEVDTSAAYAQYLRAHPNGRHATDASQQRALVEDDEAFAKARVSGTSAAYEGYLSANPNGRHKDAARRLLTLAEDDEGFALATEKGTSTAFDEYLKTHPSGRHVDEARRLRAAALHDEAEAERVRAGRTFNDCARCPKMVVVPPGSYMMGSPANEEGRDGNEGPVHRVRIPRAFAVGVHEITFQEWDYCTSRGGCGGYRPPDGWNWGRGRRPVMDVSWDDAQIYVTWLSRQTGATYRLLSEAEWEYVARAGTRTPYFFGSRLTTQHANYGSPIGGRTSPVGSYRANRFGLYDVHGNVHEWVADCWHDDYHGAPDDGSSWQSEWQCSHRVVRGGAWSTYPQGLRSADRFSKHAAQRYADVGFRVARDLYP